MQKYVLSELDSGERVISERLEHVRSVAIGFWIGAGSRDEKADRAALKDGVAAELDAAAAA